MSLHIWKTALTVPEKLFLLRRHLLYLKDRNAPPGYIKEIENEISDLENRQKYISKNKLYGLHLLA